MPEAATARPRPWLFVGTIPKADFPLILSPFAREEENLVLGSQRCAVNRGTPAMLAAAAIAHAELSPKGSPEDLYVLASGDTGKGEGTRQVYRKLADILPELCPRGITFHYLLPDVDWHNRILLKI